MLIYRFSIDNADGSDHATGRMALADVNAARAFGKAMNSRHDARRHRAIFWLDDGRCQGQPSGLQPSLSPEHLSPTTWITLVRSASGKFSDQRGASFLSSKMIFCCD